LGLFLFIEIFIYMKSLIKKLLREAITIDIEVGDVIMGGKFKNKKITVKEIGKNDKGDITINGKPLLRFRTIEDEDQDETTEQK
jgi:hypothetical protein